MTTKTIEPREALRVLGRYRPCAHGYHDTRLGDGTTWARCEDCGSTFDRATLPRRQEEIARFDAASESLAALVDEVERLRAELDAARAALGPAWLAGAVDLAEGIRRKTAVLERLGGGAE